VNHRIFERKLRSRGLTPREHVRLSAASISIHSTSLIPHTPPCGGGGIGGTGFTTAGSGGGMASDCVNNGDCAPTHTHRYIYIIVCEALMCHVLSLSVLVGRCWSCVYGVVVAHTPGIAVCAAAAALLACPPFIGRRLHGICTLNSIMPCLCAWTRSHIYIYLVCVCVCVCVSHTHTHTHTHATPNPLQHPHTHTCI